MSDAFVPSDLAVFGQIDPVRTTTTLSPTSSTIEAGSKLNFILKPMPDNVVWSVKDVDGNIAQPGAISATGEYSAPSADALPDGAVVVMVTAEGTLNGSAVKSSALVSVLHSAIVANPLYATCETGKTFDLSAQSLDQETLQWTLLTEQWGSQLTVVDPADPIHYRYTAGTNMDTATPFPIDKIEIRNPSTGAVSYISIMIEKTLVSVAMVLADSSDLPAGQAHFQLMGESGPLDPEIIKISWSKLAGPGNFDALTGIYTESDESGEFVVLSGTADVGVKLHGCIAIPLPLGKYAELIGGVDKTIRSA